MISIVYLYRYTHEGFHVFLLSGSPDCRQSITQYNIAVHINLCLVLTYETMEPILKHLFSLKHSVRPG